MSFRQIILIIALLLLTIVIVVSCTQPSRPEPAGFSVALLYAPSGKGDRSYNDMVLQGINEAEKAVPINLIEIQPDRVADNESALRNVASKGTQIVIGVGFLYTDPIKKVAPDYPNTNFVVVDGDAGDLPNVRSLVFKSEEGCYLVGAIAAKKSSTHHIGFIAGMDIPIMHNFACGYEEGAKKADPQVVIEKQYIGSTPDAFSNPAKGKDMALLMYDKGVDVIFHAAGGSGNGVIQAAKERGKFVIGVDTDQSYLAPDWVLTSMRKRMDIAVEKAIREGHQGTFKGGKQVLGLKEQGVDYVINPEFSQHIPPDLNAFIEQLKNQIISGEISVCSNR